MAKNKGQNNDQNDSVDEDEDDDDLSPNFTQDELNRALARTKRKAKVGARNEILEELGVDSLDDLKAVITAAKDANEQESSDLEAANKKIADLERKNQELEGTLKERDFTAKAQSALEDAGMDPKRARRSVRLLDLDEGASDEDIADAVEELKEDDSFSELFGSGEKNEEEEDEEEGSEKPKGKETNTGRPQPKRPPRKKGAASPQDAARERLLARHPHLAKQS